MTGGEHRVTRLLVTTAHPQALIYRGPNFGRLLVPEHFARARATAEAGIPWAADNGCYQRLDGPAYRRMLDAIAGLPGCLFVTVPDAVADAGATLERWAEWAPIARATGQPLAFVAQDGLTFDAMPWDEADALFLGGSTEWKLGPVAAGFADEAKRRGLYLHMGRVNTRKRLNYARLLDCDSVDGTGYSRYLRARLAPALAEWVRDPLRRWQYRLMRASA